MFIKIAFLVIFFAKAQTLTALYWATALSVRG